MNKTNSKVLYLTQVTLKERAILSQNEFFSRKSETKIDTM